MKIMSTSSIQNNRKQNTKRRGISFKITLMDYTSKYGRPHLANFRSTRAAGLQSQTPMYSSLYTAQSSSKTPKYQSSRLNDQLQDRFSAGPEQFANAHPTPRVSEFEATFNNKTTASPNLLRGAGERSGEFRTLYGTSASVRERAIAVHGATRREQYTQTAPGAIAKSTQTEAGVDPKPALEVDFRLLIDKVNQDVNSRLGVQNELIRKLESKLEQNNEEMHRMRENLTQIQMESVRKDERINQLEKNVNEKTEGTRKEVEETKRLLFNLEGRCKMLSEQVIAAKPNRIDIDKEDIDSPTQPLAKLGKQGSSSDFEREFHSTDLLQKPKPKLQELMLKSTFEKDYSECIIQPDCEFNTRRDDRRQVSVASPMGMGGIVQMGRFHSQLTAKNTISMQSSNCLPVHVIEQKSSITSQQRIDMVFFFADPLVIPTQTGAMLDYDIRLDLDTEYEQIKESLTNAGKNFSIKREAISIDTLKQVITQDSPKILHISCHGSYDELKDNRGQFYLSIENQNADGTEYKLSQAKLESILKIYKQDFNKTQNKHGIKLAFVSACQSEEIGKIFFESGIPVVIAVNADQGIMDSACQKFSSQFYHHLLLGFSIKDSFDTAREHVRLSDCGQYETCCCAHAHKDDCVWYKLFQKDPKRAHEMHSKSCSCKKIGNTGHGSFQRHHLSTCRQFKEFLNELTELQKEFNSVAVKTGRQGSLGGTKLGGLLDEDDLEEDGIFDLEDEFQMAAQSIIPANPTQHDLTMCCCMKDMPHDESMKFVLKSRSEEDLQASLFKFANAGSLKQIDNSDAQQIYYKIDKNQLAGRQEQIHEILKFLNGSKGKRILVINGESGQGCSHLAKFSIKYIMDRGFIKHGAYYIDAEKIISEANLTHVVKKKLDVSLNDFESILQLITKKDMVFCFDNCTNLMKNDTDNFLNFLHNFLDLTMVPKVLLVTNLSNLDDLQSKLDKSKLKNDYVKLQIENLRRETSVKIIFQMCRTNDEFIREFPTINTLSEHKLFNEQFQFSPAMISEIGMLIYEGMSIDQIYEKQKKLNEEKKESQESSLERNHATMSELVYAKLLEQRADVINLVNMLSFAPEGLLLFDIVRIVYLNQQEKPDHECLKFGDWLVFLNNIVGKGPQPDLKKKVSTFQDINAPEYESLESKIIFEKNLDNINQKQFQVNPQLQDIIKSIIIKENKQICKQYLRYMSVLSRQLIRDIKVSKDQDFDPHIVSAQIDSGFLWSEPASQEDDLRLPQWQTIGGHLLVSKDEQIPWAVQHFWFHEQNFEEILDKYRWFIDDNGNSDKDFVDYFSEICINIPSIYLMLQRIKLAEQSIQKVELICNNRQEFSTTFAKIKLIQASLKLKYEKDFEMQELNIILDECQKLFDDCANQEEKKEGLAEIEFIYGIHNIKMIKQLLKFKDAEVKNDQQRKSNSLKLTQEIGTAFENACSSLQNECDQMFSEGSIASAKTWLVMAELIVDVADNAPRLRYHIHDKHLRILLEKLQQKTEDLREECHLLCVRSMYYMAYITYKLDNFKECLKYVTQCISFSKDLGLNEIQQKAQKLKSKVQETEINNNFVFAKSSSLVNPDPKAQNQEIILQSQLQDDQLALKAVLSQTGKQINLQFEVLTIELLEHIREVGCKILHLSPYMFDVQQDQSHLVIEDQFHRLVKLTPQQLRSFIAPQYGPLKVSLVVIDLINCEQFVQVFKDLGVPHVVSFQISRQQINEYFQNRNLLQINSGAQQIHKNHVLPQLLLMQANDFFVEFAFKFYLLISQNYSVSQAVLESQKVAENNCSCQDHLLKAVLKQQKLSFEDKLFNTNKTRLIPGQVLDISELRAQTNAKMDKHETRYVVQNTTLFVRLFEAVFDHTSSNGGEVDKSPSSTDLRSTTFHKKMINVYGQQGVGKTRLISEFVRHIHYRRMFQGGIYECNLMEMQTFEEIHEILNEYIESKSSAHASSEGLSQINQGREQKQATPFDNNEMLLIFDNCDEFVKKNKTQFELQLNLYHQKFKNLQIIFISKEKLDNVFSFMYLQVAALTQSESLLYMQTLNINWSLSLQKIDAQKLDQTVQQEIAYCKKLYELTQGNPQLIKLFNMINFYGLVNSREDLLEKVFVQPLLDKKKREIKGTYTKLNRTSYLEETFRSFMSSQRLVGAANSNRRASANMIDQTMSIQKTMGIKQQMKYQGMRLARFEQDYWYKRLKLSNTFDQIQREAQKSNARTLRLKNNFNYMRQRTNIVNTANEEMIKKNVPNQDNLSLSKKSRSSQSKMTMQKNVSTSSKKDDKSDNLELLPNTYKNKKTKEVIEQVESEYGSDGFDVVSKVFENEDSECPKVQDEDQSQDPQNYNEFEDSMRSKLKEDNYGVPDQEFHNLVFEAILKPNNQQLHFRIVNMAGKEENVGKLPIQLISQSRVQIYEEATNAETDPIEKCMQQADRTPPSKNWIGTDSLELSQRIMQTMMSKQNPQGKQNEKLVELSAAKVKDIETITIFIDKSLFDHINEQKRSSSQNSPRRLSDLLNNHIIQEEDDTTSSHLSNHMVSLNRNDIKLNKDQSYYSFLSQGPPKSYTALSKFNKCERNQQSELIPNQPELSLTQKPKIMVSSQEYMISNDDQQMSSQDRVSVRKSKPMNKVDQKLNDILAGTFVPEVEDVEPYEFGDSEDD